MAMLLATMGLHAQPQDIIWENVVPFQISFIDTNPQGEVVVGGYTHSATPWPYHSSFTINKYTTTGTLVWSKMLVCDSYNSSMGICQLLINDLSEIYMYVHSDHINPTYFMVSYSQFIGLDKGLVKLSADGNLEWNPFIYAAYPGSVSMHKYGGNIVLVHNYGFNNIPPSSEYYQIYILLMGPGVSSYKVLYSNWDCSFSSAHVKDDALYITGSFGNATGNSQELLYFENTAGSQTTINTLNEIDGNKFLAKLDLSTNNWIWQRNLDYSETTSCVDDEYYYAYDESYLRSRYLFKYNATNGEFLDSADLSSADITIEKLYTGLDGTLHFVGFPYSYGTISSDLTINESYATSIYLYNKHSTDALGNQYAPNIYTSSPVSHSFVKFGYPSSYPIRTEVSSINFLDCYPEVQYERTIPFVNIGNSQLTVSGFSFTNATPGLSAEVISGSPTAAGDTLFVRVSLLASYTGAISDTLAVLSNSPYVPSFKISITGNLLDIPPMSPENVTITMNSNDAVITWDAVTQNIHSQPITPDYYLIFYNGSDDAVNGLYYYLWDTPNLLFTHHLVGLHAQYMFYRVVAYKHYGREELNFAAIGLELGMPEAEVWKILKNYENTNTP